MSKDRNSVNLFYFSVTGVREMADATYCTAKFGLDLRTSVLLRTSNESLVRRGMQPNFSLALPEKPPLPVGIKSAKLPNHLRTSLNHLGRNLSLFRGRASAGRIIDQCARTYIIWRLWCQRYIPPKFCGDLCRITYLCVKGPELAPVAGASEWGRRVRELRDEQGYQILTHNDRADLKPGQYVMISAERREAGERAISKETRAKVRVGRVADSRFG
jgi:hypothetical protein